MRARFVGLVAVLVVLAVLSGCKRSAGSEARTVFFGADAVGVVDEAVVGDTVTRVFARAGEQITTRAVVDAQGFAVSAEYVRPHKRSLRLHNRQVVDDAGHAFDLRAFGDAAERVLLVDLVHKSRVSGRVRAVLLELSSAEALAVTVERRGPEIVVVDDAGAVVVRAVPEGLRTGPGAFAEGDADAAVRPARPVSLEVPGKKSVRGLRLGGAGKRVPPPSTFAPPPELRAPSLFIESDDPAVARFAACPATTTTTMTPGATLEVARALAERVHPLVDASKVDEPPSAKGMLTRGGDCDGAAALVAAAARACGVAARVVVGYRLVDAGAASARLVPHAVAEVYAGGSYVMVDATVPTLSAPDSFVPVATGLGGALSMGRVLGVVDGNDLVSADPAPVAPSPPSAGGP